jgi:ribulose-phosphate 3-epimerase
MNIVPAVLTEKKEELIVMLAQSAQFCDYVQIDIMDGSFVPSRSVRQEDLEGIPVPLRFEAHLMVVEPEAWLDAITQLGVERIIYHCEIDKDHRRLIRTIRNCGVGVGLAVNPDTPLEVFRDFVPEVDTVLFMTVNPGFYGSKFVPQVIPKIKEFRKLFPHTNIGIDGGMTYDTIGEVAHLGLDYICIGSAIFKAPHPPCAFANFKKIVDE